MFKSIIYKTALLALLAVSFCSCNKYLELRPQNGITSDKFWQTKEQLQSAVIGCYSALLTGSKAPAEIFFLWGELRADFIKPGPGIANDETNIINTTILPTNTIANWASIYRVINLCNNVLQFGPDVINKDNTLTQTQLNAYLSEALAIRALMYFYLVRSFGDVPLKITATATDDDLAMLSKSTAKDVLAQIVADLKQAETYGIASYGNTASDKGRITKFTINAIQADVYLWMDNYADCIAACDKIINSGKYGLVAGDGSWFGKLFVNGNSSEGIFELQFDNQVLNPYYTMFSPNAGKYRFAADPLIIDNVYTIDPIDPINNYDIRGLDVAIHAADQTIYKFIALSPNTLRTSDISYAHWMVYRYADVLLMKAEACANSNRGQDALDLINIIRTRGKALPATAQSPANNDAVGITRYVLAERGREFAFEGKRWYDLLRVAKRNNFAMLDVLITAAIESVPPLYQQSALSKLRDPNSLYFPIPQGDIQNDPNLVQNPFYK
ncbi:RagB/SusD family nutrient uptake outer membrane protein [Mucilaginibacter mali]|uniref:RagB/SusD family nutrient uptake outer membrane protein n=1 Tax=Mucilaginibacter mali TaxID=2740462 RepID=A0A7D4UP44_9SPHI|nr:RagB/SusD family nutrient uptake outer membrane protein [Mucilaginibacter mali]QKJ29760.1 RagB/SusD family nutrient uptake outer membrane protein [Mucilaginibacter mali]